MLENDIKKYAAAAIERQRHVDLILASPSTKKTVVAGPGTGKTHLFKAVLVNKTRCLTLTFVNALVEDLSLELYNLSEVKTLHGFARGVLGQSVKIFPKLSEIVGQDAKILLEEEISFDKIFNERDDENPAIEFYRKRKKYYDNYYGYASVVFAAVKYLEKKKEKVPVFEQILVDEFQDFNKLEVSLINLLAERSPTLLVGDDDQALYGFKGASAEHIRQRHSDANAEYTSFSLPYCSRCTRVIVEAVNDLVTRAIGNGLLQGRIDKQFKYFDDKEKDKDSARHPQISYAAVYANQIPNLIEARLDAIAAETRNSFSTLVIAPTKLQCHKLIDALRERGFKNIESVEQREPKDVTLMDGLRLLIDNPKNNLGWRIAAQFFLEPGDLKNLLTQTYIDEPKPILDIIDKKSKKSIKDMVAQLRAMAKGKQVRVEDLDSILKKVGLSEYEAKASALLGEMSVKTQRVGNPGLRKLPIKITTIQSSKGLSADYVFIAYFDDRFFIGNKDKNIISDQDICNFLVTLTRAKKKVFLVSSNVTCEPTFLSWIDQSRIERL